MDPEKNNRKLHPGFRAYRDYLVTMIPIAALSSYIYGWRVAIMMGIAAAEAVLCDLFVCLIRRRRYDVTDLSSVTFAWVFTMLMPASLNYGVLMFGVAATVLLGSHAFGGYGGYPFHPTAFGYALTAVSFPDAVFRFPKNFSAVPLGWNASVELFRSPAYTLREGGVPGNDLESLLVGEFEGPIGSTFCLVAISCLCLLIVHKAVDIHSSLSFMATCAVWALLFPRVSAGPVYSVLLELICGGIPFAAAYLLSEPTVSPRKPLPAVIYGVFTGLLTMSVTRFGAFEYGVCFALLAAGTLSAAFTKKAASVGKEAEEDE